MFNKVNNNECPSPHVHDTPAFETPPGGASGAEATSGLDKWLQQLSSYGDMDLAFVILAMQIQQREDEINTKIKDIQQTAKLKEAISKKIEKLRNLKTLLQGQLGRADDPDNPDNEASLKEINKHLNGVDAHPGAEELKKICDRYGLRESTFDLDPESGKVTETEKGLIGGNKEYGKDDGGYRINADMVENAIQKYTSELQRVSSDHEIQMIKLNDVINKKGQIVQLLSNTMKKEHDTQMAVINNYR